MTKNTSVSESAPECRWVAPHIAGLPRSGIRDFFELVNAMDEVISLGVGEPDFVTPWAIREATIYSLERGQTSYTSNLGLLALRQAICERLAEDSGLVYDPVTECIVTVGVSEGLDLALRATVSPGDAVIYHEPSYVSYGPNIAMLHGQAVAAVTRERDGFALDPAAVDALITPATKALLLNFPNNPTGATLSREQKSRIAAVAAKHDLLVISDEIYDDLTYEDRTPSIASHPGMRERTLMLNGFSKAYAMTGFRIGYACGPAPLIEAMMRVHQYTMLCAPIASQVAALEALRGGRQSVAEMRTEYEQRRNVVVGRFNAMGLPCHRPSGAFYVYPNISSSGLAAGEFARRLLEEERVAVVPGTAFCQAPEAANYVRCAYATGMDSLQTAMDRIGQFVNRLR